MKKFIFLIFVCIVTFALNNIYGEEKKLNEFQGVVTLHNIPAKLIKINEIIQNPKPGTSYIGEKNIIVEIDENKKIMANWTVVKVQYYQYPKPKKIKYMLFSKEQEVTVKYHAVKVELVGDLSSFIKQ